MSERAQEVAAAVRQAADALHRAAGLIPDCDCETLSPPRMSEVMADLIRAEAAAAQVHKCFQQLELKHGGGGVSAGLATLETQPLTGLPATPGQPSKPAELSIAKLADEAASELTGGQCC